MKKIFSVLFAMLLVFILVACDKDKKEPIDYGDIPTEVSTLFNGDWNRPGLYEKNGTEHVMPEVQQATGMILDVTDFGAKSGSITTDNFTAFKNAIDQASAGDTVYIPDGTYYFKNSVGASSDYITHISLKSGIILEGQSKEGVKLVSNFPTDDNTYSNTTVIAAVNVRNVVIKNLTVTSNTLDSVLPDPDNQNLQNTVFTAPRYGITLASAGKFVTADNQAKNIVVDNVIVEKYQRMGVRIAKSQENVVKNSIFRKAVCLGGGGMGYGVNIQGEGPNVTVTDTVIDTKFNIIENNEFVGPYLRHGALVQYEAHNNLIKENKFTDLLLDAIDMHGEREYSNEICENTITNTRKGAGVGLGNTGATHAASGRNNYVHSNEISGGDRGIDIILGTPNTIVYKNTISDVNKGITCNNANGTIIIENEIKNIKNYGISITYAYDAMNPSIGIPDYYTIRNNSFTKCGQGIYLDSKGSNMTFKDNTFIDISSDKQLVDISASFILPEKSGLMDKVDGTDVLATDTNFVTTESKDSVGSQKNMKFKASNTEPQFNRMIYAKFDRVNEPVTFNKVYLCITAKAQEGTPTINIWVNETWTNWSDTTITWNNSLLHNDMLGIVKQTEEHPLTELSVFKFPIVDYNWHTYYIDITEGYNNIQSSIFTMVLTNEAIDEIYMEVYSKEQTAGGQAFRLIYA